MGVGFWKVSDKVATGNSSGKPQACQTPRLTCPARSRRCMWHGLISDQGLRMAMTGLPSCSAGRYPSWRIRDRWLKVRSVPPVGPVPNQAALRSVSSQPSPRQRAITVATLARPPGASTLDGGRTAREARPSCDRASFTTVTLSAEASSARSSSKARTDSQCRIAASKSLSRSARSKACDSFGTTLTRPEVNPLAPMAQYAGA